MSQPRRLENEARRNRLISRLAPALINVDRDAIMQAPYAITPYVPDAQEQALIDHAVELGGPPGMVIGRQVASAGGQVTEILLGWERLQAFIHKDAFPHAPSVPVGLIDCSNAEAAFYAIEYAAQNQRAAGLVTSPLLYASAAQIAIDHFTRPEKTWNIQTLANALCIARPTLSNRLRLLKGLAPGTRELLQEGLIKPEFAKILLAEHAHERQEHLARLASRGMMSSRALYRLVHPDYEPPQTIASPRGQARHPGGDMENLERALSERYGTAATLALGTNQRSGFVELPFYSLSELQGLLERLQTQITTDPLVHGTLTLRGDSGREINALLLELGANTDPTLT